MILLTAFFAFLLPIGALIYWYPPLIAGESYYELRMHK